MNTMKTHATVLFVSAIAILIGVNFANAQSAAVPALMIMPPPDRIAPPPSPQPKEQPAWRPNVAAVDTSMFRKYLQVPITSVTVPTVVEVALPDTPALANIVVVDVSMENLGAGVPSYFHALNLAVPPKLSVFSYSADVVTTSGSGNQFAEFAELRKLVDGDLKTSAQLRVRPETHTGSGERLGSYITIDSDRPITSSSIQLVLEANVSNPTTIELSVPRNMLAPDENGDGSEVVIAKRPFTSGSVISFPLTTATRWSLNFGHDQPLRISEIRFLEINAPIKSTQGVRFLYQPKHDYTIFYDPDRSANQYFGESGNLYSDVGVMVIDGPPAVLANPNYKPSDQDSDGVPDTGDNCPRDANPDQTDVNANGIGDICDDFDKDGVYNLRDNCRDTPNMNQYDTDSDGVGDACDDKESRFTEAHPWLPWAGMGVAALVLVVLFFMIAHTANVPKGPPELR